MYPTSRNTPGYEADAIDFTFSTGLCTVARDKIGEEMET
jgi:hypothetical protein